MTNSGTIKHAWILACGTELTLGHSIDTNSGWLAQRLAGLGIETDRIVIVPDVVGALESVLREASRACDLILLTGGLGPTVDDLTRTALAEVAGVPLELDSVSLERIRAFFTERGREMLAANQVQAMLPRGGRALANTCGTAPGIAIDLAGVACFAMPGVPFEMKQMFEHEVQPALTGRGTESVLLTRQLHCFGRGESDIGQDIRDLMAPDRNPLVGTRAGLGVITLRIDARAADRATAEIMLNDVERELRLRLGEVIYASEDESLAAAVGNLLVAGGQTVAVAESCTGGLIGQLLTDVSGSSRYFLGGVMAYADEAKSRLLGVPEELIRSCGAVSPEVAAAMANGATAAFGSDWAVSVTGIAGPTGGSPYKPVGLVYVGYGTPSKIQVEECRFGERTPRAVIRERAARSALNQLRLSLLHTRAVATAKR